MKCRVFSSLLQSPVKCLPPTIFWFHHGCLFSKNLVGNPNYFFQHTDFYLLELEQEGGQKCTGKQILSPSPFFPYWYTWNQKILQPDVNSGLKTCVWHLVVLLNFCCWKGLCFCIFFTSWFISASKGPHTTNKSDILDIRWFFKLTFSGLKSSSWVTFSGPNSTDNLQMSVILTYQYLAEIWLE